jgi:hypothetical protein
LCQFTDRYWKEKLNELGVYPAIEVDMATRREREPLINITVVMAQKYSQHHMKFDLSPYYSILNLKQEMAKVLRVPSNKQQWLLRKAEVDDRKCLNDYNITESDIIQVLLREDNQ